MEWRITVLNIAYDDAFRVYAKRFFGPGHDWHLFKAQAMAESGLDPNARSWVGARGLMQLMPATFKEGQSKNDWMRAIDDPCPRLRHQDRTQPRADGQPGPRGQSVD